ncbi:MAG: DinB family protein [Bacteroidota bacterium]
MIRRPEPSEYAPFYAGYVEGVPEGDLVEILSAQPDAWAALLDGADADHAYADGKWTVRELTQHVVDTERVFAFRALWWARGDEADLPGFDQDVWVRHDPVQPLADLLAELRTVRAATLAMLRPLAPEAWDRGGVASSARMTVRAAAWIIAGHTAHHERILRERYV